MKRAIALMLMLTVILACLPAVSLAAKQMEDGVPVWNEETVRQYALDYIEGKSMSRLWGYYDLQIRRYMPMETYEAMLTDLEWMTGAFIELGSYRCFEEPENQLKTHVLHLIMESRTWTCTLPIRTKRMIGKSWPSNSYLRKKKRSAMAVTCWWAAR